MVCTGLSFACLWVIGLGMTIGGAFLFAASEEMDPSEDFVEMEDACQIKDVDAWTEQEREGYHYHCEYYYEYKFTVPDEGTTEFDSKKQMYRVEDKCYNSNQKSLQDFDLNEIVDCWKPTKSHVHDLYNCGNSKCYKIFDPADEEDTAKVAGIVLLSIGITFFVCGCPSPFCIYRGCVTLPKLDKEYRANQQKAADNQTLMPQTAEPPGESQVTHAV